MLQTLKEIATEHARKQPKMVDALTEKAPILERLRWIAASHGLWNVAEKVDDIKGAAFVDMNAPLPTVDAATGLIKVDTSVLGGRMEVPKDTADQFGGPSRYFGKKQDLVLKKSGMDTERKLFYEFFRKGALKTGNVLGTEATAGSGRTIVAIRFDEASNTGIYDATGFEQGRLFRIDPIANGGLYDLRDVKGHPSGYGVELRSRFGWQMIAPEKTVAAIVNIQDDKLPTRLQIDDLIDMVRGDPTDTLLLMSHRCYTRAVAPFKTDVVRMTGAEKSINTRVDDWNGIPIVTSYNIEADGKLDDFVAL